MADGGVAFYLGNFVAARIARLTYGVECLTAFDGGNPEHASRAAEVCIRPSGRQTLPNAFRALLSKASLEFLAVVCGSSP